MSAAIDRLDEQLRRALEGEAWHGPSVLESLAGVSAAQAAQELALVNEWLRQFIRVTQHNVYHAGQIALLTRALAATDAA